MCTDAMPPLSAASTLDHGAIAHTVAIANEDPAMRFAPSSLLLVLALASCATTGDEAAPPIPENAVPNTYTESNGDVITEYRVGTQLRIVKVVPARGFTYYIYDRNGDGVVNEHDARRGPLVYFKLFSW